MFWSVKSRQFHDAHTCRSRTKPVTPPATPPVKPPVTPTLALSSRKVLEGARARARASGAGRQRPCGSWASAPGRGGGTRRCPRTAPPAQTRARTRTHQRPHHKHAKNISTPLRMHAKTPAPHFKCMQKHQPPSLMHTETPHENSAAQRTGRRPAARGDLRLSEPRRDETEAEAHHTVKYNTITCRVLHNTIKYNTITCRVLPVNGEAAVCAASPRARRALRASGRRRPRATSARRPSASRAPPGGRGGARRGGPVTSEARTRFGHRLW